jgi:hypothetical protein
MLCGYIGYGGPGCGYDLSLTLEMNHEEDKFPSLRDDLPAFLGRDQGNITRRDYLRYPIQFPVQSNNKNTRPRLIYNMNVSINKVGPKEHYKLREEKHHTIPRL